MIIPIVKFGVTLVSRQSGREAVAAFESTLRDIKENEPVIVDFEDVITLTPSWCDEFITTLLKRFGSRVSFEHTNNASVKATLQMLQSINTEYKNIQF